MPRPFVLLDRDGTINVDKEYIGDPALLELIPGAAAGLRRLQEIGCGLAVVSNQSGVAKGFFDVAAVERVNARLHALLAAEGVTLDGVYVCTHQAGDGCNCRKPNTGLVEQAVRDHGFDPREGFVVGDKVSDIELGKRIGAMSLLVRTGYGRQSQGDPALAADRVVDDLGAACVLIAQELAARRQSGSARPPAS